MVVCLVNPQKKKQKIQKNQNVPSDLLLQKIFKMSQFQTIIYASSDTPNVGDYDGDVSETKLTERQQKIPNLLNESPIIIGKQMSEILSVSQRTIERDLSALQKMGGVKNNPGFSKKNARTLCG